MYRYIHSIHVQVAWLVPRWGTLKIPILMEVREKNEHES